MSKTLDDQMRPQLSAGHVRLLFEIDHNLFEILVLEGELWRIYRTLSAGGASNFSVVDQKSDVRTPFDYAPAQENPQP